MKQFKLALLSFCSVLLFLSLSTGWGIAQTPERTVGVIINEPAAFEGYNLFIPQRGTDVYLINNAGKLVHSWEGEYRPGGSIYLLKNGNLLRTGFDVEDNQGFMVGGRGGIIQEYDWDGNKVWEYIYSTELFRQHHDIQKLPNGNVLILAWELKTMNEAIAAGRDPVNLPAVGIWPEHIIEVNPSNNEIVWRWHIWDHIIQDFDQTKLNYGDVAAHPELVDINYVNLVGNPSEWLHSNSMFYNPELDQIIIGIPTFNEFWIIDHSTTIEQAAGHTGGRYGKGGDLLYRWGNPVAFQSGTVADQQFSFQHKPHWIEPGLPGEGNILIFNNGRFFNPGFTSVWEIVPPVDANGNYPIPNPGEAFGPEEPVWTYIDPEPTDFFARIMGGGQRLPNGNTLICYSTRGTFFEVTPAGDVVWKYVNPVLSNGPVNQGETIGLAPGLPSLLAAYANMSFRVERYGVDFPGFDGKDLTGGDPLEQYPLSATLDIKPAFLNAKNKGVLPVVIKDFDATAIDPNTIWLETITPLSWEIELDDLTLKFDSQDLLAVLGPYSDGQEFNLHLTGCDLEGNWFIGSDNLVIKSKGKMSKPIAITGENILPEDIALLQNYPNPFNPSTNIEYRIKESVFVSLKVYDVLGNEIATLVNEEKAKGIYEVEFNGNELVSGGIYFYRLQAGDFAETKKMILIK